jgi:hypothetical protein
MNLKRDKKKSKSIGVLVVRNNQYIITIIMSCNVCSFCGTFGEDVKLRQCGGCHELPRDYRKDLRKGGYKIPRYCSKECQKIDWSYVHKHVCQGVKKLHEDENEIEYAAMITVSPRTKEGHGVHYGVNFPKNDKKWVIIDELIKENGCEWYVGHMKSYDVPNICKKLENGGRVTWGDVLRIFIDEAARIKYINMLEGVKTAVRIRSSVPVAP